MSPPLDTPRLRLRAFRHEDAGDVFAYACNPEVARYCVWSPHTKVDDAQSYISSVLARREDDHCWAIRRHDDDRVIGAIEVGPINSAKAGLHYCLDEEHWNKGLMTEAARHVVDWAFLQHPDLNLITTSAVAENVGSRRVMEKCGMVFQEFREYQWEKMQQPVVQAVYSITRAQWERSASAAAK